KLDLWYSALWYTERELNEKGLTPERKSQLLARQALLYARLPRLPGIEKVFQELLREENLHGMKAPELVAVADALTSCDKLDQAFALLKKTFQLHPSEGAEAALNQAVVALGDRYAGVKKWKEAVAVYTLGLEAGLNDEGLYARRGQAYASLRCW